MCCLFPTSKTFTVDRTKDRPLASGTVTSTQAVAFLGLKLTAGLGVLLQLNWYRYEHDLFSILVGSGSISIDGSILLGASSLAVVTIYPFMKRITYWPQAVLGMPQARYMSYTKD